VKEYDQYGNRGDSEIQDLNEILYRNLNINNGIIDGDGNINDFNPNQDQNDDDDNEQNFDGD
jgi:hypothetical protein